MNRGGKPELKEYGIIRNVWLAFHLPHPNGFRKKQMKKKVPYRKRQSGSRSIYLVLAMYPLTSISHCHPIFFPKVFMAGITIVLAIKNKLKICNIF